MTNIKTLNKDSSQNLTLLSAWLWDLVCVWLVQFTIIIGIELQHTISLVCMSMKLIKLRLITLINCNSSNSLVLVRIISSWFFSGHYGNSRDLNSIVTNRRSIVVESLSRHCISMLMYIKHIRTPGAKSTIFQCILFIKSMICKYYHTAVLIILLDLHDLAGNRTCDKPLSVS